MTNRVIGIDKTEIINIDILAVDKTKLNQDIYEGVKNNIKEIGRLEYTLQSGEVISLIKILDNLIRTIEECCDVTELYDRIVDKELLIRRINISANRLVEERVVQKEETYEQLDLFTDYETKRQEQVEEERILEREKWMQHAKVSKDLG